MDGPAGSRVRGAIVAPMNLLVGLCLIILPLAGPQSTTPDDPNAAAGRPTVRRPFDLRVFNNMDQSIIGLWDLEIPESPTRRLELKSPQVGPPGSIIGVDAATGVEVLSLTKKKDSVGFEGQLKNTFAACGVDTLPISELLQLGDAIVLKFETRPPAAACPSIDGGHVGRMYVKTRDGGPVKLKEFGDISSTGVRDTYSIGGDRPNVERSYSVSLGGVSVDDGAEVRFIKRVKAPLDGTYWFEIEVVLAPEQSAEPPHGFLTADLIRLVGSLTLKRVK